MFDTTGNTLIANNLFNLKGCSSYTLVQCRLLSNFEENSLLSIESLSSLCKTLTETLEDFLKTLGGMLLLVDSRQKHEMCFNPTGCCSIILYQFEKQPFAEVLQIWCS